MVSGNRQLQQMSVIGFMKRPWQVGPAAAGPGSSASSHRASASHSAVRGRSACRWTGLQELIDAQTLAVLGDERGHLTDAELRRERALLVVEHRPLPAAHQVQVGPAGEDHLHLALALVDELACTLDLLAIARVDEEQRLAQ